jgi:HSP20 family protein
MEVIMRNEKQMTKFRPEYGLGTVVDNFFNNTMRRFFDGNLWDSDITNNTGTVPVNVREKEHQYEVDVIAPGCRREDFNVQVKAGELVIAFSHNEEKQQKDEKAGWVRNEYVQRSFSRNFTLDETVDTGKITAKYIDGILQIVLPKNEKAKPMPVSIDVK